MDPFIKHLKIIILAEQLKSMRLMGHLKLYIAMKDYVIKIMKPFLRIETILLKSRDQIFYIVRDGV